MKTICLIGAFDTKAAEYAFVRELILARGHKVLTVNTGIMGSTILFPVDVEARDVARAGGGSLERLRERKDRGEAIRVMCAGAPAIVKSLHDDRMIDAIIGMGGTGRDGGRTAAMRAPPGGRAEGLCLHDGGRRCGAVRGDKGYHHDPLHRGRGRYQPHLPRDLLARGRRGLRHGRNGYRRKPRGEARDRRIHVRQHHALRQRVCGGLSAEGYEVLIFHATGTGGKTMENLVREGLVDAVLDITTTKWADTVCGGVFDAGPERLDAAGRRGIPHLIVPGCVDMANFNAMDSVPEHYRKAKRTFYEWTPSVTLMRTKEEENEEMGRIFAEKAMPPKARWVSYLLARGIDARAGDNQPFCDREADRAMFDAVKAHAREDIEVVEMDCNINDPEFAAKAVEMMLALIGDHRKAVCREYCAPLHRAITFVNGTSPEIC